MLRTQKTANNFYQGSNYENQNTQKDTGFYDPSFKPMVTSSFLNSRLGS